MALSPKASLNPQKRLLVCCARLELTPAVIHEVRSIVGATIDWDFLLRSAAEHAVTPLLSRQLCSIAADLIDPSSIGDLKSIARSIAIRNLVLVAELVGIMERLSGGGVQAIPYKGPVLAVQAYDDVALREFEDLDIILPQRDISKAHDAMLSLGYNPKIPDLFSDSLHSIVPAEYMYIHRDETPRRLVELHTERTLRHFPRPLDFDNFASRLAAVSVGGHDLRTFSPEDTLILLSIHGSKHFWERLSWVADIAAFVQRHPGLSWDSVFSRASALRSTRIVDISLALAVDLFDLVLLPEIGSRVRLDSEAISIASQIKRDMLSEGHDALSAVARFHRRRHLVAELAEGWRYAARLAMLPSDDDWYAVRLPASLAPLYCVLRPFRLLRKYGLARADSPRESLSSRRASN